jgi:hypothetical protein
VVGYRRLDQVARTLAPILVRRTKEAVLKDLPERMEKRFFVPMTQQQMDHHDQNREIVAKIVAKWRRYGYLSEIDQKRLTAALQNMRMSCDSTYLLDGQSDHGRKADELMTLLDEILEDAESKVVVFSQWLRMHELVTRRLEGRRLGHVLFHGGVPGPRRKDLVDRFRQDPACRLFLSTDAGGVGLNLQHASVVANMDLPWNPAVLEQRIGRVHRLGQHRPVRVVYFIAKGSIEEGMLNLLSFKRSVFSGVLDGGKSEVFLGGTRLKQFMESVERASETIPAAVPEEGQAGNGHVGKAPEAPGRIPPVGARAEQPPVARGARAAAERPPVGRAAGPAGGPAGPVPSFSGKILADVLTAGASFLTQLGQALRQSGEAGGQEALIGQDASTGRSYLKLPLPQGEAGHMLLTMLQTWAAGLQEQGRA